jgi:Protein of unknown function (DUF1552)
MSQSIDRRMVLRGFGTALSLPLLEAMMPLTALAQSGTKSKHPVRMAFVFVPNGINMEHWTPKAEGKFSDVLPSVLSPLSDLKTNVNLLTGLTQRNAFALGDGAGDHARSAAAWLTGCHPRKTSGANIQAGISFDQLMANHIGDKTRFSSIEIGCERGGLAGDCDSGYSCAYSNSISWRSPNTPVAKEVDPRLVFERLFQNGDPNETPAARDARIAENKSILDFVLADAKSLHNKLGVTDRMKLDEYMTGVREIERRLTVAEQTSQQAGLTNKLSGMPSGIPADYTEHVRLLGDMMVLAFQTDITRVGTFMFANEGSNRSYKMIGVNDGHHELSHHQRNAEKLEAIRKINQFHVDNLAYMLRKMRDVREGDRTLLDNTMVVYGGGIGDGDRHNHDDLPILVAGGAATGIKSGRHIKYKNNTPMTNLFLTMADKAGVPVESIGDSSGRLDQLF